MPSSFSFALGREPLKGTFTSTTNSASFSPVAGKPFNITLTGTFSATVQLKRSFDNGSTWSALTVESTTLCSWTGNISTSWVETEANVLYRLECTYSSGTVTYRIST